MYIYIGECKCYHNKDFNYITVKCEQNDKHCESDENGSTCACLSVDYTIKSTGITSAEVCFDFDYYEDGNTEEDDGASMSTTRNDSGTNNARNSTTTELQTSTSKPPPLEDLCLRTGAGVFGPTCRIKIGGVDCDTCESCDPSQPEEEESDDLLFSSFMNNDRNADFTDGIRIDCSNIDPEFTTNGICVESTDQNENAGVPGATPFLGIIIEDGCRSSGAFTIGFSNYKCLGFGGIVGSLLVSFI